MLSEMIGISSEVGRTELISKRLYYYSNGGLEVRIKTQVLCREHRSEVSPLTAAVA